VGRTCGVIWEQWNGYRILVGKPEGRDHWEDQNIGGWRLLSLISERQVMLVWTGFIWLRIGTIGRLL
jgi:hypothetical protein